MFWEVKEAKMFNLIDFVLQEYERLKKSLSAKDEVESKQVKKNQF